MRLDNFFCNGKSQPGSLFVFATGKVGLVETIEDQPQAVLRDSDTTVLDGDKNLSMLFVCLDANRRVRVGKFNRVVEQVV